MDESNENRIREWRLRRGMTLDALAHDVGIDPSTLWRMETGRRSVSVGRLKAIGKALDVPQSELVAKGGGPKVPIVGFVSNGCHLTLYGRGHSQEVTPIGELSEHTVAAEIRGACLGPVFDGWLMFYDDIRNPVAGDMIGKLCVVGLDDEQIAVKQIREEAGRYHLFSNNTDPPLYDAALVWAAPVIRLSPGSAPKE